MNADLLSFVRQAISSGESRDAIRKVLANAGWQADEIADALGAYADVKFPVPVPKRRPYLSAREAFLYLLLFLTLYLSAIAFGAILFQFIFRAFPNPIDPVYYDGTVEVIRLNTAILVITFPIFLGVTWIVEKAKDKDPEKRSSKIRKWLTYITLFIAAGVIIGTLITLVFNLLAGDLTVSFILRVLTVAGIAGAIFGYYLWDLRSEEKTI